MDRIITLRLDQALCDLLDQVAARSGRSRSEVVREALQRQLGRARFEQVRRQVLPLAEARGLLEDPDVAADLAGDRP